MTGTTSGVGTSYLSRETEFLNIIFIIKDSLYSGASSLAAASRVHTFCNLQRRARTHAVLVIGLHELLGNPTT
jgi:hypothetical protein